MADEDVAAAGNAPAKGKRRLVLIAAAAVVTLAAGGVGGAWWFGALGSKVEADVGEDHAGEAIDGQGSKAGGSPHGPKGTAGVEPVFVDLPNMLVNLVDDGGNTRFLKLTVAVEVDDEKTAERIERLAPRIVDSFQLYLRTLTPGELRGPGSMFRLKEDLHVRIHQAIEPTKVRDVLFKEMLVQ